MDIERFGIKKTIDKSKTPSIPQYEFVIVNNVERPGYEPDFYRENFHHLCVYTTEIRK
jgi:hypothetical protein